MTAAATRRIEHPQAIRAVFFDVGFTLLAPHPSVPEVVSSVCARRGTPVQKSCLEKNLPHAEAVFAALTQANPETWGDDQAINEVWRAYFLELLRPCLVGIPGEDVRACAQEAQRTFDEATSYSLYSDAHPVLERLKAHGLTLGVISDWGISLGVILRHHDLTQYFDFAVISATLRRAKPDPFLYQTALQRADAIPDYAVHIGDSYVRDVLGARAAGIAGVMIDRSHTIQPETVDCPLVYDLYGLLDLLELPLEEQTATLK